MSDDILSLLQSRNKSQYTYPMWAGMLDGIASVCELDGPGLNPGGDEIYPPVQTGPGAHSASFSLGNVSVPGGN